MKADPIQKLFQPVDARPLDVFRVLFGIVLALQVYTYVHADFIGRGILAPRCLFTYDWLPFVKPLPAAGMYTVLALTFVAPLAIAFNKWFRVAVAVYLVAFGYLFLLEESYYNNHFYFILLLSFLFLFYRPGRRGGKTTVPYWLPALFRLQVVIVYFYGGVAKLNADWLVLQQPVRELLALNAAQAPFPALARSEWAVYYLAYGGLAFDLAIGFLLWWRRTFKAAVVLTVVFHLTNFWIFNTGEGGSIGIFPLLMIGANVLFMPPDMLERIRRRLRTAAKATADRKQKRERAASVVAATPARRPAWVLPFLVAYLAVQLLVPFRHLLVPGNTDWTGQQQWFSWRMKVSTKRTQATFALQRFEGDPPVTVDLHQVVNTMQANQMAQHADMIYKFVQYLKQDLHDRLGIDRAIIHADVRVSFNGRPVQRFVNPEKDLFDMAYHPWGRNDWILELEE